MTSFKNIFVAIFLGVALLVAAFILNSRRPGGADFVQWHGNYEILYKMVEMKQMAEELRTAQGK